MRPRLPTRPHNVGLLLLLAASLIGGGSAAANANAAAFTVSSSIADGSTLSGSVIWTATASGGDVSKIEFSIDGNLEWTEYFSVYQYNGDPDGELDTAATLDDGPHTLAVRGSTTGGRRVRDDDARVVDGLGDGGPEGGVAVFGAKACARKQVDGVHIGAGGIRWLAARSGCDLYG
jgi:Bacterial Ig domain